VWRHFLHFAHAMPATPEGISKTSFRLTRRRPPQPWHTMNFGNKNSIILPMRRYCALLDDIPWTAQRALCQIGSGPHVAS
jgi:hypothetical protein